MSRFILACRGCLATDVQLYDMQDSNLKDLFRELIGSPFQDIESNDKPQFICSFCKALLLKYTIFRRKCRRAQELLEEIEFHGGELTTDFISYIDRPYYGLTLNLTTSNPVLMDNEVPAETNAECLDKCEENTTKPLMNLLVFEDSNNDEIALDEVCNEYIVEAEENEEDKDVDDYPLGLDVSNKALEWWCRYCGESFLNDVGLRNHKKKTHFDVPTTEYLCHTCGTAFLNAKALETHGKTICSENACVHCGNSFESDKFLKFHILHFHRKAKRNLKKCDSCYTEFDTTKALARHLSLTNGTCCGLSSCMQCGKSFITVGLMKKHVVDKHVDNEFVCQKCGKTFPNIYSYGRHYEVVHLNHKNRRPTRLTGPKRWGVVSVAGATVIAGNEGEEKEDSEDGCVVCEYCGKICMNNSLLEYHQLIHTREKPYKCVMCQKGFTTPILLKQHIRVHTGERPHKCEYCPKMFKSRSALNRHTLVHTGERRHVCQLCNRAFMTSTHIKTHIKKIHINPQPAKNRRGRMDYKVETYVLDQVSE